MNTSENMEAVLEQLFLQARSRFGSATKSYWFHESDACPGCGHRIDALKIKGQDALSLNVFIYQEHHVLIGYLLCSRCAAKVFRAAERNPGQQTPLHATIETNLIKAYHRHLQSLDT
ncbi:MAG TPA: hypothetical protein EYP04_03090 [Anaerolineae bacterium]|nr:hypothetical protein [Anaerolineae bacterium]HIQ06023.1 hypothetical protein [Anaerolineae bacterium]